MDPPPPPPPHLSHRCEEQRKDQERSGKIRKDQERSGKIRKDQERSGKVKVAEYCFEKLMSLTTGRNCQFTYFVYCLHLLHVCV